MSRLFANGTEGEAWVRVWCEVCANDANQDCPIVLRMILDEPTPEIIPERDGLHLPALHVCTAYSPPAGGDPYAETRVNVVRHTCKEGDRG